MWVLTVFMGDRELVRDVCVGEAAGHQLGDSPAPVAVSSVPTPVPN